MYPQKNIYRLGIALSGGGAKGFAHLGVLQALDERGLYPEVIAGTSAGALAGVLYADGYSPGEIWYGDPPCLQQFLYRDGFKHLKG